MVGLCRKKHAHLARTTLRTLLKGDGTLPPVLPPESYIHNKTSQLISIKGGGEIQHFGFDDEKGIGSYNFGAVAIDEGIELDEDEYTMLRGRIRNDAAVRRQIAIATNPGDPSHFLHERFIRNPAPGTRVINTTSLDNFFLPKDYIDNLKGMTGTAFDRYVMGKWVAYEGAIYPMFDPSTHVRTMKNQWAIGIIAVDWGFSNPFCALTFLQGGSDDVYISGEHYESRLTITQIIDILSERVEALPITAIVCDPSQPELIQELLDAGLPAYAANNAVLYGIGRVQEMLAKNTLTVAPSCDNLIKELQAYKWKESESKDEPQKTFDHAVDALRYGCVYWQDMLMASQFDNTYIEAPSEEWNV